MRLIDQSSSSETDPLVLRYGKTFTMRSIHGRMLTYNTHDYSAKTFLNALVQIASENVASNNNITSSSLANNNNKSSVAASSVHEFLRSMNENSTPSHFGRFQLAPCSSKVKKDSPVCYGHIVHMYFVRDQDQKKESCGKYLIMNGNFPQLGFVNDGDHQNAEPITVSAIKTLPNEELLNFPVRIGEDIGLKRVVCNQLDQFYVSCRKTSNVCQRNKSTNLASWEKITLCHEDGKSVTATERERLLGAVYAETNYCRDRTVIVSFRNQFKKAVPKENIPTEEEIKNVIESQIGFAVEEVSYLDSMNDWSNEQDEEEIEEATVSSLGEAQKEYSTPKVLQTNDNKDKKIFTKYGKVVLKKKYDRDLLGHLFYFELTKTLFLKFMIPKEFAPRK